MSEKKCSCERQMIAALIAGAALMLVVGFVLGWAWNKRQGTLSDVRLLDVLTVVGTCGAAIGAVFIAYINQRWREEEITSGANLYIHSEVVFFLDSLKNYLEWRYLTPEDNLRRESEVEAKILKMEAIDLKSVNTVNQPLAVRLLELRAAMQDLLEALRLSRQGGNGVQHFWMLAKEKLIITRKQVGPIPKTSK